MEVGDALPDAPGAHLVKRFVEKPDAATAASLVADGKHLWNSGMFVFTARTLLTEMATYAPEVLAAVRRALDTRSSDLDFIRLGLEAFSACPNISLDYAVAERTKLAAVVPADLGCRTSGAGAHCGILARRTPTATCPSATCCWRRRPIAMRAATACSPQWSV